jgi:protocadherin Fat 4
MNGQLVYVSQLGSAGSPVNMPIEGLALNDGQWHNFSMVSHYRGLRLMIDGHRVGDELDSAGVHDFLDPYLTVLSVGGVRRDLIQGQDLYPQSKHLKRHLLYYK